MPNANTVGQFKIGDRIEVSNKIFRNSYVGTVDKISADRVFVEVNGRKNAGGFAIDAVGKIIDVKHV